MRLVDKAFGWSGMQRAFLHRLPCDVLEFVLVRIVKDAFDSKACHAQLASLCCTCRYLCDFIAPCLWKTLVLNWYPQVTLYDAWPGKFGWRFAFFQLVRVDKEHLGFIHRRRLSHAALPVGNLLLCIEAFDHDRNILFHGCCFLYTWLFSRHVTLAWKFLHCSGPRACFDTEIDVRSSLVCMDTGTAARLETRESVTLRAITRHRSVVHATLEDRAHKRALPCRLVEALDFSEELKNGRSGGRVWFRPCLSLSDFRVIVNEATGRYTSPGPSYAV